MVIQRERRDRVEVLRLHRPEARNAINSELATAIEGALDDLEADPTVRVVVITGGRDHFCAGADLKAIAAGRSSEVGTRRGGFGGITSRDFPKPLVAAVNGPALAGGLEIALACDLVVAADDSRFGLPEVRRGLFAAAGGLIRLPKRIPRAVAMELALTGAPIDAARAAQLGLVNRVVAPDLVLDHALELAAAIAANAPLAVRNTLRMVREATDLTEAEAWPRNDDLAMEVFASPDAIEGPTAFAEKREPRWADA